MLICKQIDFQQNDKTRIEATRASEIRGNTTNVLNYNCKLNVSDSA